jgi:hypothetical protein
MAAQHSNFLRFSYNITRYRTQNKIDEMMIKIIKLRVGEFFDFDHTVLCSF